MIRMGIGDEKRGTLIAAPRQIQPSHGFGPVQMGQPRRRAGPQPVAQHVIRPGRHPASEQIGFRAEIQAHVQQNSPAVLLNQHLAGANHAHTAPSVGHS